MAGADLQDFARRAEPVDARHQRSLQRGRDRQLLHRLLEHVAVLVLVQLLAFEHRFGQLLDEQRHAVGALDDLVEKLRRQRFAAGDVLDQRRARALREPVERQHGDMRLAGPRRLEIRSEGDDKKNRQASAAARPRASKVRARSDRPNARLRTPSAPGRGATALRAVRSARQECGAGCAADRESASAGRSAMPRNSAKELGRRLCGAEQLLKLCRASRPACRRGLKSGGVLELCDDRRQRAALNDAAGRNSAGTICASFFTRSSSAAVRRDLPMPASPASSTTRPSPSLICCQRRSRSSISSSRPISGARLASRNASKRLAMLRSRRIFQAPTGSAKPLSAAGAIAS